MSLKMKPEHLATLAAAIKACQEQNPDITQETYAAVGLSSVRYRWDIMWASRVDGLPISRWVSAELYSYLNDTHIDSALRQILRGQA